MNTHPLLLLDDIGIEEKDVSWPKIEKALIRMDGYTHTLVTLGMSKTGSLMAGGGNERRYTVVFFPEEEDSLTLTEPKASGPNVQLVVGGQPGDYESKHIVSQAILTKVFQYYWKHARLPGDTLWEIANTGLLVDINKYM